MKVRTKSADWERDRSMELDHPLYRALSSGRKRTNGKILEIPFVRFFVLVLPTWLFSLDFQPLFS